MAYEASDVGPAMVNGEEVLAPLAEREAMATKWNANKTAQDSKAAADAVREARLAEIQALMAARTASLPDMQEYLLLKET